MKPQTIRAILFDFDGVLVNSIPSHGKAWRWIMRQLDIEVDEFVAPLTEGLHSYEIAHLIFDAANAAKCKAIPDDELQRLIDRKRAYYREIVGDVHLSEEVIALMHDLRKKGYLLALVTSTSRENLQHVIPPEKQSIFDIVLDATHVTRSKPDPEPYAKAIELLKLKPEECIVVENAVFGIRSARAAGAWCIAVTSTLPEKYLAEAHLVINNVVALQEESTWKEFERVMASVGNPGTGEPSKELIEPINAKLIK